MKTRSLVTSLGLHVAAFFGLMYSPPLSMPTLPSASPSEYQQAFAGKEDQIVWYKFHDLPDIAPKSSPKSRQPLRADQRAKQAIISSPKNAPKRDQVVLTPVPKAELPPLDLPNLIAVKLPPKQFTTPPDVVRPDPPKIETPDAPEATPQQQIEASKLPAVRLPPREYVPPKAVAKSAAPEFVPVPAKEDVPAPDFKPSAKLPDVRLPAKAYVPPPKQPVPEPRKIAAATEVQSPNAAAPTAVNLPSVKLPARAYVPPPAPPPPPTPRIEAPAGDVTIAIAGLNPTATAVKLPAASSPAAFAAGEKVRPDGAVSDGSGKGIVAPDLFAHGTNDAKPDLLARTFAAPTSKEFMDNALRHSATATAAAAPVAHATKVTNAPDPRFNGRDVYMMAVQTSNLTSYSGHWLMWYAARSGLKTDVDAIAAPVPRRKVDPKYIASAVEDHVEGRVQLYCVIGREGLVRSIELLRGADERLNKSAEEALSKWEFYPATRDGQAVEVDVVVEIPFVLAPK